MSNGNRDPGPRDSVEARLSRLSSRSHGVFTFAEAIRAGISKQQLQRRIATCYIVRRHPTVFVLAGAPKSWVQDLTAASKWAGVDAAVSGRTAARLWEIAEDVGDRPIELRSPRDLRHAPPGIEVRHIAAWQPGDICRLHGLTVTTPARTLIDLAGLLEEEQLRAAFDIALVRGLCDAERVRRRLQSLGCRGRRGISLLRRIIEEDLRRDLLPQSELERRYLQASSHAKLPRPVAQYPVNVDGRTFLIDFAYPEQRLAIELDGWRFHGGRESWQADIRRSNALVSRGWHILRGTWKDVQDGPEALLEQVKDFLRPTLPLANDQ